jgi:hypothetical protein
MTTADPVARDVCGVLTIAALLMSGVARARESLAPEADALIAMFAVPILLISVALTLVLMPRGDDNDADIDVGSPDDGGPDPVWWPEFEAQFRAYARATARNLPRRHSEGDSR